MKIVYFLLLLSLVSVLACTPANGAGDKQQQGDQALAGSAAQADTSGNALKTSAYEPGSWITDYQLALQYAAELKRPVLINFTGSDWCGWCKKLSKEVFTQDAFVNYAKDNLVLLKIDFPQSIPQTQAEKDANSALAKKYAVQGYPTIVLVDEKGTELQRTGYQYGGAEKYVTHLQELLKTE